MKNKSTIKEIQERFDNDVERFSNLETGQVSTLDATLSLEFMTDLAKRICPEAKELLDVGCGAGNYTVKMLSKLPKVNCTLVDLSKPMLERAEERISSITNSKVITLQGDIREVPLQENHFDIILAGAVLHHLREDQDWETTFEKLYKLLKKGGCLLISDFVAQDHPFVQQYITDKYEEYLSSIGGKEYAKNVFAYIEKEDSPRSVTYQMEVMKKVGFSGVEIIHKNLCFSTFCGIK